MAGIRRCDAVESVLRPLLQSSAARHQSISWEPNGCWPAHNATTVTTKAGDFRTLLSLEGDVLASSTTVAANGGPLVDLCNPPSDSFSAVITYDEVAASRWASDDASAIVATIPAGLLLERVLRRSRITTPSGLDVSFGEPFRAGMAIRFHRILVDDVERWTVVGVGRQDCWLSVTLRGISERSMGEETPVLVMQGA